MFSFPTLKAWRNSFLLFIPAYGAATVIFLFAFWLLLFIFFDLLVADGKPHFFFLGMALLVLVVALIWYLLVDILYLLFLQLFWSKPPKFLMSPPLVGQKLSHFGVAIIATFPLAAAYLISFIWKLHIEELMETNFKLICAPDFMLKLSWLWLIAAAYVYRWKCTFEKKI